jgi:proteasome lid subunit RPN8/RPN11
MSTDFPTPSIDFAGLHLAAQTHRLGLESVSSRPRPPHIRRRPARGRLWLTEDHVRELRYLAELSYPFEACGLLVGTIETPGFRGTVEIDDGTYDRRTVSLVLASNLSPMPERRRFVLDPQDYLDTVAAANEERLEILGVWHSHPDQPAVPSALDLENAWAEHSQLIVSVDAMGDTVLRSWRLAEGRFTPEAICIRTRH